MACIITQRPNITWLILKQVHKIPVQVVYHEVFNFTGLQAQHKLCCTSKDLPNSSTLRVRAMHTNTVYVRVEDKVKEAAQLTRPQRANFNNQPKTGQGLLLTILKWNFYRQVLQPPLCSFSYYSTSATEQSPDFASLSQRILDVTKSVDVRAGSLPLESIENLMQSLYNLGFNIDQITELLSQRLWLLQEPEAVIKLSELLLTYGIKAKFIVSILENLPVEFEEKEMSLHKIPSLVDECFEHLRNLGLSDKKLLSLVAEEPYVIFTDPKTRTDVLNKLKGLFTHADALRILQTCPNVLSDSWSETQAKFEYAFFNMYYDQRQIIKAKLFKHSLENLEDRHIFLVRAGFFMPVKKKDDPRLNPNPPLSDIIDKSDGSFAKTFGDFSFNEYRVYLEMRELERDEEEEENASDEYSDEMSSSDEAEEEHLIKKKQRRDKKHKR